MDAVYVVKRDVHNDELRYSLRSLAAHVAHDNVWLAGFRPPWTVGVHHIDVAQDDTKYRNSTANLRAACEHPDVSDPFLLMNDDFFVMHPVAGPPMLHRGPVSVVVDYYRRRYGPSRQYLRGMVATSDLLHRLGIPDPLSYELHLPIVIHKAPMLAALTLGADIPVLHKRTLYGNLSGAGGDFSHDVKVRTVHDQWDPSWPFLSTSRPTFHRAPVGHHIRAVFDAPGPYETAPAELVEMAG